jgi:hypothetical protein
MLRGRPAVQPGCTLCGPSPTPRPRRRNAWTRTRGRGRGLFGEAALVVSQRPPDGIPEEDAGSPGHSGARDGWIVQPERSPHVLHHRLEVKRRAPLAAFRRILGPAGHDDRAGHEARSAPSIRTNSRWNAIPPMEMVSAHSCAPRRTRGEASYRAQRGCHRRFSGHRSHDPVSGSVGIRARPSF